MSKSNRHSFLAELGNLLILAEIARQKKTAVVSPVCETKDTTTVNQRQPVTSVNGNDTKQS